MVYGRYNHTRQKDNNKKREEKSRKTNSKDFYPDYLQEDLCQLMTFKLSQKN